MTLHSTVYQTAGQSFDQMIKISVVIPIYNRYKTLQRCISSVIDQTKVPYEIIIIDDGSLDYSVELAKDLLKDSKLNFKILKNCRTKGANGARNTGIIESEGDWVMFLDSDDHWVRDKIEVIHNVIVKNNEENIAIITDTPCPSLKSFPVIKFNKSYPVFNVIGGFSKVTIKKSCFNEIGYLDEKLKSRQDLDIYIRILHMYNLLVCNKMLTIINYDCFNRISNDLLSKIESTEILIKKYNNIFPKKFELFSYCRIIELSLRTKKYNILFSYLIKLMSKKLNIISIYSEYKLIKPK